MCAFCRQLRRHDDHRPRSRLPARCRRSGAAAPSHRRSRDFQHQSAESVPGDSAFHHRPRFLHHVTRAKPAAEWPLWGGVTRQQHLAPTFRSDAMQMRSSRSEDSAAPPASLARSSNWTFSWTFSKEYSLTVLRRADLDQRRRQFPLRSWIPTTRRRKSRFSGVWDLPFGKGRRLAGNLPESVDKFVSGWRVDYIFTYISGFPVGMPNVINTCGNSCDYTDPATGQKTGQNEFHWFNNNPACYRSFRPTRTACRTILRASRAMSTTRPRRN